MSQPFRVKRAPGIRKVGLYKVVKITGKLHARIQDALIGPEGTVYVLND